MSEECESYIKEKATNCLLEIGVPANLQGFKYMRDAILYIVRDPRYKRGVTKRLYPMIAEKYEVTWSSLFICKWKNGKETHENLTEYAFANARTAPDTFKSGVIEKIKTSLK